MATDSSLPVGSTGESLETVKTAANVHREGAFIGDPVTDAARVAVSKTIPDGTGYGLNAYVQGNVTVTSSALPAGAATSAAQGTIIAGLASIDSRLAGTLLVATGLAQPLTDAQLRASAVPVAGTFFQATQPVSIAATVTVSGPVTDAQLRASAVPVSGPLTDAQLRASAVPVSGGADHALTFAGDKVDVGGSTLAAVTSLTQFNGQAIALNTGARSAGTLRVTVATDDVVPVTNANLDVALSTRLKPADTLAAVTALGSISTSVTPGTAAAHLGKAEDAVHASGDTGVMSLGVRNDTLAVFTSADGDYAPYAVDNKGQTLARETPTTTIGTAISGANAAATLTLAAAGAGLFHYLTAIEIVNVNPTAAAIAGSAVTLGYTTTNLPGSLAWTCGNALAAGAEKVVTRINLSQPIKSSVANTATTIVAPAIGAGGLCRMTAYYYIAP